MCDILCDMIAANRQDHRMPDIAVDIDCQVSCTAADIADRHAHLAFLLSQNYFAGGERVQYELLDIHACRAYTLAQVVTCCCRGRDNVRLHFETIAMHALRITDAILSVNGKAALDHVDDLTVMRDGHGTGLVKCMDNVVRVDH